MKTKFLLILLTVFSIILPFKSLLANEKPSKRKEKHFIVKALKILEKSEIYPNDGKLSLRALYNSLRVWLKAPDLRLPYFAFYDWLDKRSISPFKAIVSFFTRE